MFTAGKGNDMAEENRKQETIQLCQSLIRTRSYSGEEQGVVEIMKNYAKQNGFDDIHIDRYGNCILKIKGKKKGPRVLFDGHMDTVPVPDPSVWKHDPFGAEIVNGRIYGRGTSDMKGAIAGMLSGAAFFLRDTDRNFAGEIYISGVVHEECFEGVAAREISKYVRPDYVIIGEASQCNVKIGQRGRGEIVVETFGKPAHSSNPEKGINAVYKMSEIVNNIKKMPPVEHPFLGKGILELTDIKSMPYPGASVVPYYCRATYDRRLLKGETKAGVLRPIKEMIKEMKKNDPHLKAKVSFAKGKEKCYTGEEIGDERFFPGWLYDSGEDYIQAIVKELQARGWKPEITKYNFCTNGSHYAGEAGIKAVGMGPSRENLAHTVDEYVEVSQLTKAADCYYGIMKALLKPAE